MQYRHHKTLQKSSSSSIKLPQIYQHISSNKSSKNSIKMHDHSLQTINIRQKNKEKKLLILRPSSINQKAVKRYAKEKSKSRVEPLRLKTENVGYEDRNSFNPQIYERDAGNTLKDFRKCIEESREHIHEEINKKMQLNNIVKNIDRNISMGMEEEKLGKRRSKMLRKKNSEQAQIFNDIQKIINKNSETTCTIDLNQVEKKIKIADLKKNLRRLSPQRSIADIEADIKNQMQKSDQSLKVILKDQSNYYQWRRVHLHTKQELPYYSESTLDIENQRLKKLALQTQASICKYLENKKFLLQLKSNTFKVNH